MEIHALSLVLNEKDLDALAARHLPEDQPVEELRFRVTPEGLYVSGEYPLFLRVAFETLWELGVRDGDVTARLLRFKALGLPVPVFKSMLLKILGEGTGKHDWLELQDDTVRIRVDQLLAREGVPLRTNLTAVRCQGQDLVIEAGRPAPSLRMAGGG
jgi:hypothetical protein